MDLVELNKGNQNRHPWEFARADCALELLSKFSKDGQYADVGAGDIYFATRLSQTLSKKVYVVDTAYTESGEKGNLIQLTDIKFLPDNSLDVVLLMDVIEHIDDVDTFLTELMTKMKVGAQLLIMVPAHQFLFSQHDVFLKHYRRYNMRLLKDTIAKQPLEIERSFYFFTLLFIARCFMVLVEKLSKPKADHGIGHWGYPENHFVTRFITGLLDLYFKINYALSKIHITIPGLTVCAVCRKKS